MKILIKLSFVLFLTFNTFSETCYVYFADDPSNIHKIKGVALKELIRENVKYVTIKGDLLSRENILLEANVTETVTKKSCLSSIPKVLKKKEIQVTKKENSKEILIKEESEKKQILPKKISTIDGKIIKKIEIGKKNGELAKAIRLDDLFQNEEEKAQETLKFEDFVESYTDNSNSTLINFINLTKQKSKGVEKTEDKVIFNLNEAKDSALENNDSKKTESLDAFRRVIRGIFDGK